MGTIVNITGFGDVELPDEVTDEQTMATYLASDTFSNWMGEQGYDYTYEPEGVEPPPAPDDSFEITKGFKHGVKALGMISSGAAAWAGDVVGHEGLQDWAIEAFQNYAKEASEVGGAHTTLESVFEDENQFDAFTDWLMFNMGSGAATAAPILLASLVPGIGTPLAVSMAYGMGVGDVYGNQLGEAEDPNAAIAGIAGVPYAAAERAFGAGSVLAKKILSKVAQAPTEEAAKQVTRSAFKEFMKSTGKTMAGEATAEAIQEAITSTSAKVFEGGENFFEHVSDQDFWKSLGESAAAGAAGGTSFGVAGGFVDAGKIKHENREVDADIFMPHNIERAGESVTHMVDGEARQGIYFGSRTQDGKEYGLLRFHNKEGTKLETPVMVPLEHVTFTDDLVAPASETDSVQLDETVQQEEAAAQPAPAEPEREVRIPKQLSYTRELQQKLVNLYNDPTINEQLWEGKIPDELSAVIDQEFGLGKTAAKDATVDFLAKNGLIDRELFLTPHVIKDKPEAAEKYGQLWREKLADLSRVEKQIEQTTSFDRYNAAVMESKLKGTDPEITARREKGKQTVKAIEELWYEYNTYRDELNLPQITDWQTKWRTHRFNSADQLRNRVRDPWMRAQLAEDNVTPEVAHSVETESDIESILSEGLRAGTSVESADAVAWADGTYRLVFDRPGDLQTKQVSRSFAPDMPFEVTNNAIDASNLKRIEVDVDNLPEEPTDANIDLLDDQLSQMAERIAGKPFDELTEDDFMTIFNSSESRRFERLLDQMGDMVIANQAAKDAGRDPNLTTIERLQQKFPGVEIVERKGIRAQVTNRIPIPRSIKAAYEKAERAGAKLADHVSADPYSGQESYYGTPQQKAAATRANHKLSKLIRDLYPGLSMQDDINLRTALQNGEDTFERTAPKVQAATERGGVRSSAVKVQAAVVDLRLMLDEMGLTETALEIVDNLMVSGARANAAYWDTRNLIMLSKDAPNQYNSVGHEALHALKNLGVFKEQEWKMLEATAKKKWLKKYNIEERYPFLNPTEQLEEAIAEEFAVWVANDGSSYPPQTGIEKIWHKIKDFLDNLFISFREFDTAEALFAAAREGVLAARAAKAGMYSNVVADNSAGIARLTTKQFRKWFGKGAVTDKAGNPKIVWHATGDPAAWNKDTTFKQTEDIGFHFGTKMHAVRRFEDTIEHRADKLSFERNILAPTDPEKWDAYQDKMDGIVEEVAEGSHTMPFFLNIQNPVRTPDLGTWKPLQLLDVLVDTPGKSNRYDMAVGEPEYIDPIFTYQEGNMLRDQMTGKSLQDRWQLLRNAIRQKGYDGIVYKNRGEATGAQMEGFAPFMDAYIAFEPEQIKSAWANNGDYDLTDPNFRHQMEFTPDPHTNEDRTTNAPNERTAYRGLKAQIAQVRQAEQGDEVLPSDLGKFGKIVYSMRHMAATNPLWAKVWIPIEAMRSHRMVLANEAGQYLKPVAELNSAEYAAFVKAAEIAMLNPGQYRRNADGEIILINNLDEGGRGADSNLQPGETVILRGRMADAYEQAQQAMDIILTGLKDGYLNGEADNITRAFKMASPELMANPEWKIDSETLFNLTYAELNEVYKELGNQLQAITTTVADGEVKQIPLEDLDTETRAWAKNLKDAIDGIAPIRKQLGEYERRLAEDYFPMQRFGQYYIAGFKESQLDEDGYPKKGERATYMEFFETKRVATKKQKENAARDRMRELRDAHPDLIFTRPQHATSNLVKNLASQEGSFEVAFGLLSSSNREAHEEVMRQLEEKFRRRGFSAHLQPREKLPGYSLDLRRSMAQYVQGGAGFAARLRHRHEIETAKANLNRYAGPNMIKYADEAVKYVLSPDEEFRTWRHLGFIYYLGGNLSSAILQVATLPQFTLGYLSQYTKPGRAAIELTRATKDVTKIIVPIGHTEEATYQDVFINPNKFTDEDPELKAALIRALEEGIIKQHAVLEEAGISAAEASVGFGASAAKKSNEFMQKYVSGPFSTVETLSRATAFVAAYRLAQKNPEILDKANEVMGKNYMWQEMTKGKPTAYNFAEQAINDTFGLFGKYNRPEYMRGAGSVIFQFQLYIHQMFELMARMFARQGADGKRALAGIALMLFLTAGLRGLPGADDAERLIAAAMRHIGGFDVDVSRELREALVNVEHGHTMAEMLENGIFNALGMADVQRRISMGNLPGSDVATAVASALAGQRTDISDILGVPGSIAISQTADAYHLINDGRYTEAMAAVMPTALKNFMNAAFIYPTWGVRSRQGTQLVRPEDMKYWEMASKAVGFTPTKISNAREYEYMQKRLSKNTDIVKRRKERRLEDLYIKQAEAYRSNDEPTMREVHAEIQEIIQEYLDDVIDQPVENYYKINLQNVAKRAMMRLQPERRILEVDKHLRGKVKELEKVYKGE